MRFYKVIWSPVELEYLEKNKDKPINQLTISLAKSRNAIQNKLKELSGQVLPNTINKKRSNIGRRKDLNNLFMRSSWEANVLRLLKTDTSIQSIQYEPKDFTFFEFGIKKGTLSYTPDFLIVKNNGDKYWIEVKGGMLKQTDKVKIRRFKKFYPEEAAHLVAITPSPTSKTTLFFELEGVPVMYFYNELNKKYKHTIPEWE